MTAQPDLFPSSPGGWLKLSTYTRDKLGGVLLDGLPSAIAKAMPEGAVVKFGKQGHWYVRADVTDKVDGLLADSEFIRGYEKHLTGMKAYAAGKRIGRTEALAAKVLERVETPIVEAYKFIPAETKSEDRWYDRTEAMTLLNRTASSISKLVQRGILQTRSVERRVDQTSSCGTDFTAKRMLKQVYLTAETIKKLRLRPQTSDKSDPRSFAETTPAPEIQPSKSKLSAERLVDTLDAIDGKLSRVATMLDAVVSDSREQKVAIETLTARVARLEREVEKLRESERVEVGMDPAVIQRPSFFGLFRRAG